MYNFTKLKDARGTIIRRNSIGKLAVYDVRDSNGKVVQVPQHEFAVHGERYGITTILNQKYVLPLGITFQWDVKAKCMGAEPVYSHQALSKVDGAHTGTITSLNKPAQYAVLKDDTGASVVIPFGELGSIVKEDIPKLSIFDNPDYVVSNNIFNRGMVISWDIAEPAKGGNRVKAMA